MIAVTDDGTVYYYILGLSFIAKGLEMEFRSLLTLWTAIDFSRRRNLSLCELPLSNSCHSDEETPTKIDRDDDGIDGGNLSLCELPLSNSCPSDEETPTKIDRDDDGIDGGWMRGGELSMGYILFMIGKL
ncbi:hypothetical protein Gotur_011856 [Gossypium turneri]